MESISAGLNWLNGIVWGVPMLILILGIGLYLTFGLRARSVTQVPLSLAFLWKGRHREGKGEITPFNALMKETLLEPGIHHKFVKALEGIPGIRIFRKSGTWMDHHADSALVEYGARRYVVVGIAEHRDGGEWLARLGLPLHRLVVAESPSTLVH